MQQIHLDLDHPDFYCPVTGKRILGEEVWKPSSATRFLFIPEAGEFAQLSPEYEEARHAAMTEVETDATDEKEFFDCFLARLDDAGLVVFSITTRGMACGPAPETVHLGIDMNHQGKEEARG